MAQVEREITHRSRKVVEYQRRKEKQNTHSSKIAKQITTRKVKTTQVPQENAATDNAGALLHNNKRCKSIALHRQRAAAKQKQKGAHRLKMLNHCHIEQHPHLWF